MISLASLVTIVCCQFCIKFVSSTNITTTVDNPLNSQSNETLMYFAYGSNLLSKRILNQNPTAKRRSIGQLKGYRLDFNTWSHNWNGNSADIVEEAEKTVWGVIWEIDISNMEDLDRQEAVPWNIYKAITKIVETPAGEPITCRLYQKVNPPAEKYNLEELPLDRQPSRAYMDCILNGAVESQLPVDYINILKAIPHNNRDASNATYAHLCD